MTETTTPGSLREAALAALADTRAQRISVARGRLEAALAPASVADLEVVAETAQFVVFSDGADVCLAVHDDGLAVHLVRDDDGWTSLGKVESLVDLGVLLAAQGGA